MPDPAIPDAAAAAAVAEFRLRSVVCHAARLHRSIGRGRVALLYNRLPNTERSRLSSHIYFLLFFNPNVTQCNHIQSITVLRNASCFAGVEVLEYAQLK